MLIPDWKYQIVFVMNIQTTRGHRGGGWAKGQGCNECELRFLDSQENNFPSSRQRSKGERHAAVQENEMLTSGDEGHGDEHKLRLCDPCEDSSKVIPTVPGKGGTGAKGQKGSRRQ